jgi:hypothetical protein
LGLPVERVVDQRIWRQEPSGARVVDAAAHVDERDVVVVLVACEA